MGFIQRFALFWYDFIVGDDWMVAVGVLLGLAATWIVARTQYEVLAWVLLPIVSLLVLVVSLERGLRAH